MKRHRDALAIDNPGACNPSGIAHSIIEACTEIRTQKDHSGTDQITRDPAVRLMVHQLAAICGMEFGLKLGDYADIVEACKREAQ